MIQLVFNGQVKKRYQKLLSYLLIIMIVINSKVDIRASNNRDYLNISLADIIITWYNASGVAIGNTYLLNEIESIYGGITIEDLVDNDIIVSGDNSATKEDIKTAIGYGSASVPYLRIDSRKLRTYLNGLPTDELANKALRAMFSWENNATEEAIFEALGIVVGNVVNIGKIGYNVIKDTLVEGIHSLPLVRTLKDVYNNFTNSTYFQDLINKGTTLETYFDYTPYTIISNVDIPDGYELYVSYNKNNTTSILASFLMPPHVYAVVRKQGTYPIWYAFNNTDTNKVIYKCGVSRDSTTNTITINSYSNPQTINSKQDALILNWINVNMNYMESKGPYIEDLTNMQDYDDYSERDPWNGEQEEGAGVTDYINKSVGNITKQNYINLAPNIGNGEYMFIFNKYQYDVIINQITDNTNNGDYSTNGDIITTYNTTYIQNPISSDTRPTYIPAPTGQPIQPFISPRPTPVPAETEEAIYNGGITEAIKDKFPFCIPWDIQALVSGLWTNNRQAPYIHWDARFGSWGKLGEVTIDLQPYDTAAQIFRSTTLLLWIVGLVVLTRNLIGS